MVSVADSKSNFFPVRVGLRQGCPLSQILIMIFMDRISRCSQAAKGVKFIGLQIPSLLFADDMVLLASLNCDLQFVVAQFATECEVAGMRISTSKSEAMILSSTMGGFPAPGLGRVGSRSGRVQVSWGLVRE